MEDFNMFNTSYPYYQNFTGYRIIPVAKIEETASIFPDLQGNPLFFFDQARNEIYVKQRKVQTGEVETLKYTLSIMPMVNEEVPDYMEHINALRSDIEEIKDILSVKVKKAVKDDEQ